jgi:ABC-type amino acid transport substrate-binding protein
VRAGLAAAVVVALVTGAHAEPWLEAIRSRGVLRVGVKVDAPPFGSLDVAGRPVGFEVDLARFFARVLFDDDHRAALVPVTTATRFEALQAGRVDLLMATVTATDERGRLLELSAPYFMAASLVLARKGSGVRGLSDLAARPVAVVRDSVQWQDVAELQPRALLRRVGSVEEGVGAVRRGWADAFVYDDVVLLSLTRDDPALEVVGAPLVPRAYVVAARPQDAGLIRWVNGWLARMRRDGSYDELWRRHFGPFEARLVGG